MASLRRRLASPIALRDMDDSATFDELRSAIEKELELLRLDDNADEKEKVVQVLQQATLTSTVEPQLPEDAQQNITQTDIKRDIKEDDPKPTKSAETDEDAEEEISSSNAKPPPPPYVFFRRPELGAADNTPQMTDSYEAITLSELRQLDSQWQSGGLASAIDDYVTGEYYEEDEFEEVDEFEGEEPWEAGLNVDGEWDCDDDTYLEDEHDAEST
jgi:hypothetical protein